MSKTEPGKGILSVCGVLKNDGRMVNGIAPIMAMTNVWTLLMLSLLAGTVNGQQALTPREVKVLPVFLVPEDEAKPTADQADRLARHLEWAQARYRELLADRVTFGLEGREPRVYRSKQGLAFYRSQPEGSAPQFASELLAELNCTRYNCPYILVVVLMNAKDGFPPGGGRPLNGGYDTGGGIVILSSFTLDRSPNFQSTLQHELGHAFGLPHVNVYGYDMRSSDSIMSYNPKHHTNGFTPSETPGQLIPEDLRGLALNQRVFPGLRFDPVTAVPKGYSLASPIVPLGPMRIPGQPDGVDLTTGSGEEYGSKVSNIVQGRIRPSKDVGKITFDPHTMWHSAKTETGWVSIQVTFPYEVELTRVSVHSQHSGRYHVARAARIAVQETGGRFRRVCEAALETADAAIVTLPEKTKGRAWQLEFQAGESGTVVLRGLQFFSGDDELFPPLVREEP